MGSRDYRHRETKKAKKEAKKPAAESLLTPPSTPYVEVEVVRKGKKDKKEEEEQE